jgi:hypothetical protein
MTAQATGVNEIVYIEPEDYKLTQKQMMQKYNICRTTTVTARKKGYFIKNWCIKTVMIDRDNFDVQKCYRIAKNVFYRIYYNSVARFIKEDMIQEAVTRMFELSGKIHNHGKDKIHYYYWMAAKNAMEVYYKQWYRSMPYKELSCYECALLS